MESIVKHRVGKCNLNIVINITGLLTDGGKRGNVRHMNPEDLLRVFFDEYPEGKFRKGSKILAAGEDPEGMYYLVDGYVRQFAISPTNEILYLHVYKPGSCFPMMWLINETSNRYHYEAMTNVIMKRAPTEKVKQFILRSDDMLGFFTSRLLLGMDGLLARMESLVLDDAYTKTVLLFWYFAKSFGIKDGQKMTIEVPLSHREIAAWIGTARETASLQAEILKKKGIISYSGKHYVISNVVKLDKEIDTVIKTSSLNYLHNPRFQLGK
jgi:CRP-like cAMP-binding protein